MGSDINTAKGMRTVLTNIMQRILGAAGQVAANEKWSHEMGVEHIRDAWNVARRQGVGQEQHLFSLENLRQLSVEELRDFGFRLWSEEGLILIPLWVWPSIADGEPLYDFAGESVVKGPDLDLDTRAGCTAYGFFMDPKQAPKVEDPKAVEGDSYLSMLQTESIGVKEVPGTLTTYSAEQTGEELTDRLERRAQAIGVTGQLTREEFIARWRQVLQSGDLSPEELEDRIRQSCEMWDASVQNRRLPQVPDGDILMFRDGVFYSYGPRVAETTSNGVSQSNAVPPANVVPPAEGQEPEFYGVYRYHTAALKWVWVKDVKSAEDAVSFVQRQ